jgi:cytochrome c-type biogenesis protein CcmH
MKLKNLFLALAILGTMISVPALAVEPQERLEDPVLESRAREISAILRCLVCQNQSIDDSNAGLAKDLRLLVRERLVAGDTDDQVIGYIVDRYGDYVLLKPPVKSTTYALWGAPIAISFLGIWFFVSVFRRRDNTGGEDSQENTSTDGAPEPLSPEESKRLARLMKESDLT